MHSAQVATADAALPEDTVLWNSVTGRDDNGDSKAWQGSLADVGLWDRAVVPADEVRAWARVPAREEINAL
ncbi:hypothetical protein [Streptomyces sp. NPDC059814]|uniref:hypothetical protein n=1 Tax=Streptomyces sp. NPDC059814 TaxID=3346959 RepID=UPI003660AAAF